MSGTSRIAHRRGNRLTPHTYASTPPCRFALVQTRSGTTDGAGERQARARNPTRRSPRHLQQNALSPPRLPAYSLSTECCAACRALRYHSSASQSYGLQQYRLYCGSVSTHRCGAYSVVYAHRRWRCTLRPTVATVGSQHRLAAAATCGQPSRCCCTRTGSSSSSLTGLSCCAALSATTLRSAASHHCRRRRRGGCMPQRCQPLR